MWDHIEPIRSAVSNAARIVLSLSIVLTISPQAAVASNEGSTGNRNLNLKINVTQQKYCWADSVGPTLYLDLGLSFTNVSNRTVILSRKIEYPPIIQAANGIEEARQGEWFYSPNIDSFVQKLPPGPSFGKAPSQKLFIILGPAEAYETAIRYGAWLEVTPRSSGKTYGLLPGRGYLMRVGINTWPYDWPYFASTDVHKLSERWAKFGDLAYGLLYSEATSITVPETFENLKCKDRWPPF